MSERDAMFADPDAGEPRPFEFNDAVVRVFPDMISRSVPGYPLLLELVPIIARRAVQANSRVYDLGCSLCAATLAARRAIQVPGVEMIAVDNAPAMVARARTVVAEDNSAVPVTVLEADACALPMDRASLVMMAFTLQFIEPRRRQSLLQKVAEAMLPGGVLLLAEKLRHEHADSQQWLDSHHLDFKRAQGYSDLEIARKRQALDQVLIADDRSTHHRRLQSAGFDTVIDVFQCLNFSAFVAIKR